MKIACVAVVKNEARHIGEWLAYQFALGFDTVVLLDNNSTDGTTEQALRLAETHDVRIIDWHQSTPDYQIRAYEHAARRLAGKFDWLAFFDSDEFLVLDDGLDLKTCLQAREDAAAIAVPWAIFGSSGHQEIPAGLVIENFVHRAEASFGPNQHVKSIIRPARMKSCIGPHMFEMDGEIRDLAGRQLAWQMPGVLAGPPDYKMGKLHHYFTRSRAHWDEKIKRGYHDLERAADMFLDYDRNEVFDDSALRFFRRATGETSPADGLVSDKLTNIALGKPASQSSFSEWSYGATLEEDAAGAVNGRADGTRKFHTRVETNPWWQVDLGTAAKIHQIKIFNTTDLTAHRFKRFSLSTSLDGEKWTEIDRKQDDKIVGGVDDGGHVWHASEPVLGKFVRVTLLGHNCLHLDQVEVFGFESDYNAQFNPANDVDQNTTDADLFEKFVSLGDNCEFGFAQRAAGCEPLQLLRFSGTGDNENGLILALKERFRAFTDPDDLLISDDGEAEWIARSRRYIVTSHTCLKTADHDFTPVFRDELKKRSFLARKLVDDLEDGEKIFIRKLNAPVSRDRIFALHTEMKAYGNPMLLWVSIADAAHPAVTVDCLAPNLYHGFISRLAAYDSANQADLAAWRDLCQAAIHAIEGKATLPARATPARASHEVLARSSHEVSKSNLIFDIGMSEGNDSAFYLAKGFEVVGVEADIQTYATLRKRFAEPLRTGRITLYNFAAAEGDGDIVEFFHHDLYQGLSGLSHSRAEFQEGNFSRYLVLTVNWSALVEKHGVPHYLKIDVEGHEGPFLQSMTGARKLPTYASVECQNLSPVEKLFALGYRKFRLIDQQPPGGFRLPVIQREGEAISWPKFDHASGPFGLDLPAGQWLDFESFKSAFHAAQALNLPTWYDCHAWMPDGQTHA